jgi:hypothetical protein
MSSMDPLDEAIVEQDGRIRLRSPGPLETGTNVFVSISQKGRDSAICGLVLSERSLAEDWLNVEEDEAWAHLLVEKRS